MSNRAICASMKSSFTVNGVEISAGLIGLPQAQRPFGIIAHAGSSLPGLAAPAPGSMLKAFLGERFLRA